MEFMRGDQPFSEQLAAFISKFKFNYFRKVGVNGKIVILCRYDVDLFTTFIFSNQITVNFERRWLPSERGVKA